MITFDKVNQMQGREWTYEGQKKTRGQVKKLFVIVQLNPYSVYCSAIGKESNSRVIQEIKLI